MRRVAPFCILVVLPCLARAETTLPPNDPSMEGTGWSLGGGVGMSLLAYPSAPFFTFNNGFGGNQTSGVAPAFPPFAASPNSPSASLLVERRLSPGTSLVGRLVVLHSSSNFTETPSGSTPTTLSNSETDASLSLGLRVAFVSTSRVVFSGLFLAGAGYTTLHSSESGGGATSTADWTGYVIAVSAGVACDVFLTPNLALRLSTPVLALSYDSGKGSTGSDGSPPQDDTSASNLSGGLVLAPSIELRILF